MKWMRRAVSDVGDAVSDVGDEPGDGGITDPDAFELVFREHFATIYKFASRRIGPALAEDLAAEVFATAYRRRGSYQPDRGPVLPWLYGIATNALRSHWRAEQHLLQLDAEMLPGAGPDASGGTEAVDQRIAAMALAPRVAEALRMLSADQRDVLLLHVWAELSHGEIAAALGVADGTVRSRLSRARALLREQLGRFDFDLWTFAEAEAEVSGGRKNA